LRTGPPPSNQKAEPNHQAEQERIEYLEKKIQTKDEVLAKLTAVHIAPKKSWDLYRRLGGARGAGTRSWISFGADQKKPRSAPGISLGGSPLPAKFTTGVSVAFPTLD
jgi:hypothetical protein